MCEESLEVGIMISSHALHWWQYQGRHPEVGRDDNATVDLVAVLVAKYLPNKLPPFLFVHVAHLLFGFV